MTGFSRPMAAAVAAALTVLVILLAGPAACRKIQSQAAQARVDRGQSGALANSAADAIGTLGASAIRESAADTLTRQNEKDIRNASGSTDAVNPAVRDAGLRALCLRDAYRGDQRCAVRDAASR